jgi:AcrR family transcriptional regulator
VLAATWELLNEVGFDGLTVDQVSDRSGVARSTLYRHWRTMPELMRDAFAQQATATSTEPSSLSGSQALVAYARAFAVGLAEQWGRAALSLAASATTDPAQRDVQQVFVEGTRRDLRAIADALPGDPDALAQDLVDLVVAPLFYRFQYAEAATPDQAERLALRAWKVLQGR